jgi:hypothetical protein
MLFVFLTVFSEIFQGISVFGFADLWIDEECENFKFIYFLAGNMQIFTPPKNRRQ